MVLRISLRLAVKGEILFPLDISDDLISTPYMRNDESVGLGLVFRTSGSDPFGFTDKSV
jgi:hypothetical protein